MAVDTHPGGRSDPTIITFAEIELSGSTAPLLSQCQYCTYSHPRPAEAVIIGNVSGSRVHVGHRIVHFYGAVKCETGEREVAPSKRTCTLSPSGFISSTWINSTRLRTLCSWGDNQ